MKRLALILMLLLGVLVVFALGGCSSQPAATTTPAPTTTPAGHPVLDSVQLSDIAPGLGTIMVEVGHRNWLLYYAATGGNWDLAAYQAKEIGEVMEIGETTRPARKAGLVKFGTDGLTPVNAAIKAKDSAAFMTAWKTEVDACNKCHVDQKFAYMKWSLPKTAPEGLQLTAP